MLTSQRKVKRKNGIMSPEMVREFLWRNWTRRLKPTGSLTHWSSRLVDMAISGSGPGPVLDGLFQGQWGAVGPLFGGTTGKHAGKVESRRQLRRKIPAFDHLGLTFHPIVDENLDEHHPTVDIVCMTASIPTLWFFFQLLIHCSIPLLGSLGHLLFFCSHGHPRPTTTTTKHDLFFLLHLSTIDRPTPCPFASRHPSPQADNTDGILIRYRDAHHRHHHQLVPLDSLSIDTCRSSQPRLESLSAPAQPRH